MQKLISDPWLQTTMFRRWTLHHSSKQCFPTVCSQHLTQSMNNCKTKSIGLNQSSTIRRLRSSPCMPTSWAKYQTSRQLSIIYTLCKPKSKMSKKWSPCTTKRLRESTNTWLKWDQMGRLKPKRPWSMKIKSMACKTKLKHWLKQWRRILLESWWQKSRFKLWRKCRRRSNFCRNAWLMHIR